MIHSFFRTEFSRQTASLDHDLSLRTSQDQNCILTEEIRMRLGFNPHVNESPLKFKATLKTKENGDYFQGTLGKLDFRKRRATEMSIPFDQGM